MKIAGISYTCPVCGELVYTPRASLEARRPCYRFSFPYAERRCCHFGEEIEYPGGAGVFRLAVEAHSHDEEAAS